MGASSLPPLSEQDRRRDPPSLGAPRAPVCAGLPPGAQSGQVTLRPGTPPAGIPGGPGAGPQGSIARATSCHRPSSPHPAPGAAWKRGAAWRVPVPGSLCSQPCGAGPPSLLGRLPGPSPGGRHVAVPGAPRPDPPRGTHSGAAAALASWGLSGPPAPRPAQSRGLCRGSARPAGTQPSRVGAKQPPQARSERRPLLAAAWLLAARGWRGCRARAAGRGGAWAHHPIGEEAGWGGANAVRWRRQRLKGTGARSE